MFSAPVHEKLIFPKIKTIWFPFHFSDALSLDGKVLFTDCYTWQNFRPRLLVHVNDCVEYQKSRMKVLSCVTVGE